MKKCILFFTTLLFSCTCFSQGKSSNALLWRIDSKNGEAASYLFGTIHLPQKKFVEFSDSVYAAIQSTKYFYTEIDFLNMSMFGDTATLAFMQEKEKHFQEVLKTDAWKKLIDRINTQYGETLSYDDTDEFLAFAQKTNAALYKPDEGVTLPDMMLAGHAMVLGKETRGLETYRLQMGMLFDILDARLADTSMGFEDESVLMEHMMRYYLNQQLDSMAGFLEKMNPLYRTIVFDRRNKTMADSIKKHMIDQSAFFAVGAGHLAGPGGLVALLKKEGYHITPVHSSNRISMILVNTMMKQYEKNSKKSRKRMEDAIKGDVKIEEVTITEIEEVEEPPPPPPPPPPPAELKKTTVKPKPKKKNDD